MGGSRGVQGVRTILCPDAWKTHIMILALEFSNFSGVVCILEITDLGHGIKPPTRNPNPDQSQRKTLKWTQALTMLTGIFRLP
jgi:hypothetical protein